MEIQDSLGNRIKSQYEDRTRYYLPRRTYTILRLDGCHHHTYTAGLNKPFDKGYSEDIDNAIIATLPEMQGAVLAYTQSDEISILLTDFATPSTCAWFDGNIQKMVSVAASIITAEFNYRRTVRHQSKADASQKALEAIEGVSQVVTQRFPKSLAYFDCRAFTIPDRIEVMNMFRWRQQDCIRNAVSMVSYANFSHREVEGKSTAEKLEMLKQKGIDWDTGFSDGEKNGRVIVKEEYCLSVPPVGVEDKNSDVKRTRWVAKHAWVFTKDEGKLLNMIPKYE